MRWTFVAGAAVPRVAADAERGRRQSAPQTERVTGEGDAADNHSLMGVGDGNEDTAPTDVVGGTLWPRSMDGEHHE